MCAAAGEGGAVGGGGGESGLGAVGRGDALPQVRGEGEGGDQDAGPQNGQRGEPAGVEWQRVTPWRLCGRGTVGPVRHERDGGAADHERLLSAQHELPTRGGRLQAGHARWVWPELLGPPTAAGASQADDRVQEVGEPLLINY